MLTLLEPETAESSYNVEANVEMKPLTLNETEDDTDSRKIVSAQLKDDVELKSPVSAEESFVNRSFPMPAQETSASIRKQRMVVPPIKSHCDHFETEPVEVFQDNVSYHIRPRTMPWEFSSSTSTSLSIPVAA